MVLYHKSNLRIVSIKSKVEIIRDILSECDILFCQEVILPEDEIDFLSRISDVLFRAIYQILIMGRGVLQVVWLFSIENL